MILLMIFFFTFLFIEFLEIRSLHLRIRDKSTLFIYLFISEDAIRPGLL